MHDLPTAVNPKLDCVLFDDDEALWCVSGKHSVASRCIQQSLGDMLNWSKLWGFSQVKTECVLFTRRRSNFSRLLYLNSLIKISNKIKYLGMIFDKRLTWSEQIDLVISKCQKVLNMKRSVSGNLRQLINPF